MSDQPNPIAEQHENIHGKNRELTRLTEQTSAKLKELESVIDQGATIKVKSWDKFKNLRSHMLADATQQMDTADQMIIDAARQADEEFGEDMKIEWDYFEQRHVAMLDNIIGRYRLYMDIAGAQKLKMSATEGEPHVDNRISTEEEYLTFVQLYETFLKPMNLNEVFAESAETAADSGGGAQQDIITHIMGVEGLEIPDGLQTLFKKITDGETLREEDYAVLRNEMVNWQKQGKGMIQKGKDGDIKLKLDLAKNTRDTMDTLLLTALSPQDRFEVLSGLIKEANFDEMVLGLVASNYIQVSQGETLLDMAVQAGARAHKMEKAKEMLFSDHMQQAQEANQEKVEKVQKSVSKQFGHFNRAQRLLTLKNGFWGLVALNFAATFAANAAVTLMSDNPLDVFTNPGVLGGAALTGLGLEMSDGFGGVMPSTPKEWIGELVKDGNEIADADKLAKRKKILSSWGNDPHMTQLYYQNMKSIEAVYKQQTNANQPNPKVSISALHINKEDLPPALRGRSEEAINARLTEMHKTFRTEFAAETWEDQKIILQDADSNKRYGNHCLGRIDINDIQ